jgi:hypothetical protein
MATHALKFPRKCPSCSAKIYSLTLTETTSWLHVKEDFICPACGTKSRERYWFHPFREFFIGTFFIPLVVMNLPGWFGIIGGVVAGLVFFYWLFGLEVAL